jgi:hypothetical protein
MKAKQYAQMYDPDKARESLVEIAVAFDKETAELVKARGVKTDSAFKSVLMEMDLKWRALSKILPVNPEGYRIIMYKLHRSTAEFAWGKRTQPDNQND